MMIIEYKKEYYDAYKKLVKELWNDITDETVQEITSEHLSGREFIFLYERDNKIIGFINTSIRSDYVPGSTGDGVAYIEGIYVCKAYRRNQVAIQLVDHVINYFKQRGFTEIGSDSEIENEVSYFWHKAIGFKEVERCVHYIRKIGE
jgi:aminoglycoside 6'-N-acetyltransferase I